MGIFSEAVRNVETLEMTFHFDKKEIYLHHSGHQIVQCHAGWQYFQQDRTNVRRTECGSPPGVMMADTLSFNAKIGVVDF